MVSTRRNPTRRPDAVAGAGHSAEARFTALTERFIRDESGVSAIEYGLLAALIFLVILGGLTVLSPRLRGVFEAIVAMF